MGKTPPAAYAGGENATVDRVVRCLRENYAHTDGTRLSEERLLDLVIRQNALIRTAIILASFAYYPAQQIADAEGLEYVGEEVDEEDDEDEVTG